MLDALGYLPPPSLNEACNTVYNHFSNNKTQKIIVNNVNYEIKLDVFSSSNTSNDFKDFIDNIVTSYKNNLGFGSLSGWNVFTFNSLVKVVNTILVKTRNTVESTTPNNTPNEINEIKKTFFDYDSAIISNLYLIEKIKKNITITVI